MLFRLKGVLRGTIFTMGVYFVGFSTQPFQYREIQKPVAIENDHHEFFRVSGITW